MVQHQLQVDQTPVLATKQTWISLTTETQLSDPIANPNQNEYAGNTTTAQPLGFSARPCDAIRLLFSSRWLLVASYQLFVHREVFAPLLEQPDPARRAKVNEIKVECIALTEDLRFNVKDFLADETPLDWDVVTAKMAWFNGRLRKHIADVRQLMSPDLSDIDRARLIASRTGPVGAQAAA